MIVKSIEIRCQDSRFWFEMTAIGKGKITVRTRKIFRRYIGFFCLSLVMMHRLSSIHLIFDSVSMLLNLCAVHWRRVESDTNSDSEDDDLVTNLNEADNLNVDSLHLSEQVIYPLAFVCRKRYIRLWSMVFVICSFV